MSRVERRVAVLPTVAAEVLESAVPLAVLPVGGCLQNHSAVVPGPGECRVDISYPHPDQVTVATGLWWPPIGAGVGNDDRAIRTDSHLSPVTLADAGPLLQAESRRQEGHGGPHVRVQPGS